MFRFQRLQLVQYKNYMFKNFEFKHKVIGICGSNGIGKTNILDAIWYLCFTKSYFTAIDGRIAYTANQGFRIDGECSINNQSLNTIAILRETGKKEFSVNNDLYTKLSHHIGKMPAVMVAPDDVIIITGGSEERRKMIDTLICQIDEVYMQQLIAYNKILLQRNALLKQFAETGFTDSALLQVINMQLITAGSYVYKVRKAFLPTYLERINKHYQQISGAGEQLDLSYESPLDAFVTTNEQEAFSLLLQQNHQRDLAMQRTNGGIHKDDVKFLLDSMPFKQIASQGQRKSLLLSIRLTEYELLQEHKGFAPVLLLDDVFEKLDEQRMANLLLDVCVKKQGQVFITDTHKSRLEAHLKNVGCDYEIIELV